MSNINKRLLKLLDSMTTTEKELLNEKGFDMGDMELVRGELFDMIRRLKSTSQDIKNIGDGK